MTTLSLNTKTTRTNQIAWVLTPRIPTYDEYNGNLADEMSDKQMGNEALIPQIPAVDPDEFETRYCWFLS